MAEYHQFIKDWPEQSRQAAQLVINKYGEPDEHTDSLLLWLKKGPWLKIVASKKFHNHNFPAPHTDNIECFVPYTIDPTKVSDLAEFDGSVTASRTKGELSARCHDEQANFLAINLAHDIFSGNKTAQQARDYYAKEFLAFRNNKPTPYMNDLQFQPHGSADPDERVLSDNQLEAAVKEGQLK